MKIRKIFIFLILGISIFSLFTLSMVYMGVFKHQIDSYAAKTLKNATHIEANQLEWFFSEREANMNVLAQNRNLLRYLNYSNHYETVAPSIQTQVQNTLTLYTQNITGIEGISIINQNGIITADTHTPNIHKKAFGDIVSALPPNTFYYSDIIKDEVSPYMLLALPIYERDTYYGGIVFKLNMLYFEKMLAGLNFFETSTTIVLDSKGEVAALNTMDSMEQFQNIYQLPPSLLSNLSTLWSKNQNNLNNEKVFNYYINGEKKIYHAITIPQNGWSVFCSVGAAEYATFFNQTTIIILTLLLLVIIIIACYFFIKNFFSEPLETLLDDIHHMQNSNDNRRLTYSKNNEFGEIASAFNSLMDKIETDTKELETSEERYKIVLEQTKDIVIDWDIINDVAYHSPQWTEIFGHTALTENFLGSYPNGIHVVEEDKTVFYDLFSKIAAGAASGKAEYRIYNINGEQLWCKVLLKTIFNEHGEAVRAVGTITNITAQKKELFQLKNQAERDPLTKLYNKGTTEQLIREYLNHAEQDVKHALMVIDVDDFKQINDTLGHPVGDTVLADIAAKINTNFRSYDIVGRIGGDEFLVFIKSLDMLETLKNKARKLTKNAHTCYTDTDESECVTVSIGIAVYPDHGTTYEELFANADTALYEAKKAGKNRYRIYTLGT